LKIVFLSHFGSVSRLEDPSLIRSPFFSWRFALAALASWRSFQFLSLLVLCLALTCPAHAAERTVSSPAAIEAAGKRASPGDVLIIPDGTYNDWHITIDAKGTADKPITLRAQTPGKVRLDGDATLSIDGQHVTVSGIFFGDSGSTKDVVQIHGSENRLSECAIIAPNRGGKWIHFMATARKCRMDHCYIEGHAPQDVRLQVEVDKEAPNYHRIDHNHFGPRPPLKKNGGETMRIGYSFQSMRNSRTLVEDNLFDRCDGEIEIISSKSCENIYRHNTFRNCEGTLTLRHGNRCIVDGNFFLGNGPDGKPTGGIRVIGEDHTIINNYFQKTTGIAGGVIVLTGGIPHSPLAGYWQIKKCLIAFNTFVDNAAPCLVLDAGMGQKGRTLYPQDVTIANNVMLAANGKYPLVEGKAGPRFKWMGNIGFGAEPGSAPRDAIKIADPGLKLDRAGIVRPDKGSIVIGDATGNFPKITTDIDGQPRPASGADCGCDQVSDAPVVNRPLEANDVGPSWLDRSSGKPVAEGDEPSGNPQVAAEGEIVLDRNPNLKVGYEPGARTLTIHGANGWNASSAALCPQILSAPGLITVAQVEQDDRLGKGQAIEIRSDGGRQRIWVYADQPFVFTSVTLRNSGQTPLKIHDVTPISLDVQAGSQQGIKGMRWFGADGLSDLNQGKTGWLFLAGVDPSSRAGVVGGWITNERASGVVEGKLWGDHLAIAARSEYGRLIINPGEAAQGETFAIGFFADARDGLEQFADSAAKANDIHLKPALCGYSTWYHAHALDEKRMKTLAEWAKKNHLGDFGLDFLQIDDQWQKARRDFTSNKANGPYPHGMKQTAETINADGFIAGLWLTPFGWNSKEGPLASHPDWFVHRADGSVYDVKWAGDCLDMSNPQAREFLAGVIGRMTHDWGYKLLKVDGLWSGMASKILYPSPSYADDGLGDAVFHDPNKTNVEVYRDGLKLIRQSAGKDVFLLGCNIAQNMRTLGASIGLVDAMRVGPDIGASWDRVVRCAKPASRLYFLNGRIWHNDPDCIMLRDPLTLANAQAWASFVALSGQLNLVSEWLPDLPAEKLDAYKRSIPAYTGPSARPVDLFQRDLPRIWQLTRGRGDGRVDVIGLFNWNDPKTSAKKGESDSGPITLSLDFKRLGLPPGKYVGFDYWANQFVEPFSENKEFELPPGSCRIIALHRKLDHPQVVSTSRQVTQGLVDLSNCHWDAASGILSGTSKLVASDPYELRIDAAGAALADADIASDARQAGVKVDSKQDRDHVRVTIQSPSTRQVSWQVQFRSEQSAAVSP
jgi:hypothetical protein